MKIIFALLLITVPVCADPVVKFNYCYGPSMLPSYGCVQAIKEIYLPFDQLKVGMVVEYYNPFIRHDGHSTNHRLIQKLRNNCFLAKGDNNNSADFGCVTKKNYICVTEPINDFKKY